ncbi:hypothetical protein Tco_0125561, partial [Tanacetum coccineum]
MIEVVIVKETIIISDDDEEPVFGSSEKKAVSDYTFSSDDDDITILTTNTPYPSRKIRRIRACTHQKTTKETSSIRRIQRSSIRRIQDIVCEDSGRYQTWSLLQETLIHRIESLGYA